MNLNNSERRNSASKEKYNVLENIFLKKNLITKENEARRDNDSKSSLMSNKNTNSTK
jgi:hypothetical protein